MNGKIKAVSKRGGRWMVIFKSSVSLAVNVWWDISLHLAWQSGPVHLKNGFYAQTEEFWWFWKFFTTILSCIHKILEKNFRYQLHRKCEPVRDVTPSLPKLYKHCFCNQLKKSWIFSLTEFILVIFLRKWHFLKHCRSSNDKIINSWGRYINQMI